jgi:hypothetical protein
MIWAQLHSGPAGRNEFRRCELELIRDKRGRLTGVIREVAGGRERLSTPQGEAIADYSPQADLTYDTSRRRIGSGNRLPGMTGDDQD